MRRIIFFLMLSLPGCADFVDFNEEMHLSNLYHQLNQAEEHFCKKRFEVALEHYIMAESSNSLLLHKNTEYTLRICIGKLYTEMILKGSRVESVERLSKLLRSLDSKNADLGRKRGHRNNE